MTYSINVHSHRLAAWAASTSASASPLCRFKVETGVAILEGSGFDSNFTVNSLPEPYKLKSAHRNWRIRIIQEARKHKKTLNRESSKEKLKFTHGIAAKLINCYLKVRFVCGGYYDDRRVKGLHPPIDAVLLAELRDRNIDNKADEWNELLRKRWSKYDSKTYEYAIQLITQALKKNDPMWKIEEHWVGHQ